jgi:hypothetical protein
MVLPLGHRQGLRKASGLAAATRPDCCPVPNQAAELALFRTLWPRGAGRGRPWGPSPIPGARLANWLCFTHPSPPTAAFGPRPTAVHAGIGFVRTTGCHRLALFGAIALVDWLCFAQSAPAVLADRRKLGLFRAFCSSGAKLAGGIGFVLHNRLAPAAQRGRNWVCFARIPATSSPPVPEGRPNIAHR